MAAKKRKFKAHEQHLVNTVLRQAGTLWKAVLEGVMNSVDAGATRCDIKLTKNMVVIQDDGRGFETEKEIAEHFETFGTPHEEGDATYGEFRMGRGQMFAFGANDWQTNKFQMLVDIKKHGLDYELFQLREKTVGCRIEIRLYEELLPSELNTAAEELEKYVRYSPIPVTLNGKQLNLVAGNEKWDHVLPGAYLKLKDSLGEMRVYNLGMFVCAIPASEVGSGGILVSRKRLKLNFARNDVMRSGSQKCPVWAKVEPLMREKVQEAIKRKPTLTGDGRLSIFRRLRAGEPVAGLADMALFTTCSGRHFTLKQLMNARETYPAICLGPYHDSRADKVMQMKLGFSLRKECLEMLGVATLPEFLVKLDNTVRVNCLKYLGPNDKFFAKWPTSTLEKLAGELNEKYKLLKDSELKPVELAILKTIRRSAKYMGARMDRKDRQIVLGVSANAAAWTDGETYIAIDRNRIDASNSIRLWTTLGHLMTHEYCHDGPSHATHTHSPEFYEHYHDSVRGFHRGCGAISNFVECAMYEFPKQMAAIDKKLGKQALRRADNLAISERQLAASKA